MADRTWQNLTDLVREEERLKTFLYWPVLFIDKKDLAKAGLFYLREADKVQCYFCNGVIGDWQPGDVPIQEHRRIFPKCPFLANDGANGCYDVPESIKKKNYSTRREGHRHPVFAQLRIRLRSFDAWSQDIPQNPEVLAKAGFFHAGAGDHTRCFSCDLGLRNWKMIDDPWVEHARWTEGCPFLSVKKGAEFVREAKSVITVDVDFIRAFLGAGGSIESLIETLTKKDE